MSVFNINIIHQSVKRILILFGLILFSLNFFGCAKTLNPAGASEFSCPNPDNGVCTSVQDVYSNRQDIKGFKEEKAYKNLPDKDEYIERQCGVEKFLEDKTAYRMCKRDAEKRYEEMINDAYNSTMKDAKSPLNGDNFLRDVVKSKEGIPIRQPEKVTRIWIAPYENDMGDLVYSHFIYVVEEKSDWIFTPGDEAKRIRNNANPVNILNGGE